MADWAGDLIKGSGCYLCYGLCLASSLKLMAIGGVAPVPPFNPAACIPPGIEDEFAGTTFECYEVGFYSDSMQAGGKSLEAPALHYHVPSLFDTDGFSAYSPDDLANGLTEGQGWAGAYVARDTYAGLKDDDDFGSYSDSDDVDGLDGGVVGWAGSYVARETNL